MRYAKVLMVIVTLFLVILWGMQTDAAGQGKGKHSKVPAPVPQTGQTSCYDESNIEITCEGTGQDGDLQTGVPWPVPRFTDRGDGTVRDNLTGLIWLQNANCFGVRIWINALTDCNTLASGVCGLTDGSQAGDWRLPNVREIHSLIYYGTEMNSPLVSNTAGTDQWSENDPFTNLQPPGTTAPRTYWTSTTMTTPSNALYADTVGRVGNSVKDEQYYLVWPVRDAK